MANTITYEIYVQQGVRWELHARYPASGKDESIEEAKQLDMLPSVSSVKVIKEVYSSEDGLSNEYTVYKSSNAGDHRRGIQGPAQGLPKRPAPKGPRRGVRRPGPQGPGGGGSGGGSGGSGGEDDGNLETRPGAIRRDQGPGQGGKGRKRKSSPARLLLKLALVTVIAVCVAATLTATLSMILSTEPIFGISMEGGSRANVLFAIFLMSFVFFASPLAYVFLSQEKFEPPPPRVKPSAAPAAPATTDDKDSGIPDLAEAEAAPADNGAQAGKNQLDVETVREPEPEPEPEPQSASKDPPPKGIVLDAETYGLKPKAPEGSAAANALPPAAEKQKKVLKSFVARELKSLGKDLSKLDNFNRFGISLFLAGAAEGLAADHNLDMRSKSQIMAECVQMIGFKKAQSQKFADGYEDYLLSDRRYMQMFQAGRAAISGTSDEPEGDEAPSAPTLPLNEAVAQWNKPKAKENPKKFITILFTDIAGSTAMTQTLGDDGAQRVVRAHNRIVRDALTKCHGTEVKHTGDGIMASFEVPSDAIEAAIAMQRGAAHHSRDFPDHPVLLKIGLHAGQALAEDNDLFGTHVQLAARIVDKAAKEEILVSETAKGACPGGEFTLVNRGGFEMKGFEELQTLYEVVWNPDKKIALEKAQTAAQAPEAPSAPPQPSPLPTSAPGAPRTTGQTVPPPKAPPPKPVPSSPLAADTRMEIQVTDAPRKAPDQAKRAAALKAMKARAASGNKKAPATQTDRKEPTLS
ncbi:MAG: adenylate/guanylate cyclase domain-containing protein [Magnetovibrionaceae bacterium]